MSYEDLGYTPFLTRQEETSFDVISPSDVNEVIPELSASKLQGGVLSSKSGAMSVDLEKDAWIVSDGTVEIVRAGVLEDGTIGLQIKDAEGNTLMKVTNDEMYLQSSDESLKTDYVAAQILAQENKIPVALFGKQIGGFDL